MELRAARRPPVFLQYDWTFVCVVMDTTSSSSGALWETQLNPVTPRRLTSA